MINPRGILILIIDSDRQRRKNTTEILRREGFVILEANNIEEGEEYCTKYLPNLLFLISANNLKKDLKFCSDFKHYYPMCKILFSSIISTDIFISLCFDKGINECISFPFSEWELIARVKKLLSLTRLEQPLTYHGIKLFKERREMVLNNTLIYLSKKETFILEQLIENNGISSLKMLSKVTLSKDSATRMCIKRFRKKLEQNTGMRVIKTRYGVGYYIAI